MTLICPVSAIYLAASQSGQIDSFLFIYIGLKEVGGCPMSWLLSNIPAVGQVLLKTLRTRDEYYIP